MSSSESPSIDKIGSRSVRPSTRQFAFALPSISEGIYLSDDVDWLSMYTDHRGVKVAAQKTGPDCNCSRRLLSQSGKRIAISHFTYRQQHR